MKIRTFLKRFAQSDDGIAAADAAMLLALVAAVAGFALIFYGESLSAFFEAAGSSFTPGENFQFPDKL